MAYVEVWKEGVLVSRQALDEEKARSGVIIRLGSVGQATVKTGQRAAVGPYELRAYGGAMPAESDPPAPVPPQPGSQAGSSQTPHPHRPVPPPQMLDAGSQGNPDDAPDVPSVEGYTVVGSLGQGGMGVVWKAIQLSTQRPVALKLLRPDRTASDKTRARFEREVKLCARLEHPSIARIYDSGLHHRVYYYAMELVQGLPLDEYVATQGFTVRQIVEMMRTVCQAVDFAHQQGVIHRDLKPSNIMVGSDDRPRILDFGLAKTLQAEDDVRLSIEGEVAGTPAFMSPEQASGHHDQVDARTDVYALGVILYHLVTGQFHHSMTGTHYEILKRIIEEEPRRPSQVCKNVDAEMEAVLLKALARKPEDRYASAALLAADLDHYLKDEPLIARARTAGYVLSRKVHKHRTRLAVYAVAVGVIVSLATGFLWHVLSNRDARQAGDIARLQAERQRVEAEKQLASDALDRQRRQAHDLEEELARERKRQADAAAQAGKTSPPTSPRPEPPTPAPPTPPAFLPAEFAPPEPQGMRPLFNGRTLDGWEGDPRLWSVRDGAIRGETTPEKAPKSNTFLIWKEGVTKDFDLRASFRCSAANNSGIQYRSKHIDTDPGNRWVCRGYQFEVRNELKLPSVAGFIFDEIGSRGFICNVGEKTLWGSDGKKIVLGKLLDQPIYEKLFMVDQWNEAIIIARGPVIRHYLNGRLIVDFEDRDPQRAAAAGVLGLQLHKGTPFWAEFKNIRIRDLDATATATAPARTGPGTTLPAATKPASAGEDDARWGPWQDLFDGKSLKGWENIKEYSDPPRVAVKDGMIVLEPAAGNSFAGIRYTPPPPKGDFEIVIEARRMNQDGDFASLLLPLGESWCSTVFGGFDGKLIGIDTVDNLRPNQNSAAQRIDFELERWYRLRVRVTAERVLAWVDDRQVIDQPVPGHRFEPTQWSAPCKPFGIRAWKSTSQIRSIRLRQPKSEGQTQTPPP